MRLSQIHKASSYVVTALLALLFSLEGAKAQGGSEILNVICLDPGHGGHDPGCISGKTREKDLTLDISRRVSQRLARTYPGMTVVMTRNSDKYIGLGKRSQIANDAKADLFISIHINSAANKSASGFSVHCLGKSSNKNRDIFKENMDVCRRENAVVLLDEDKDEFFDPDDPASFMILSLVQNVYLEQSLKFAEELRASMARTSPVSGDRGVWQDPFYVLSRTSMPAVLVECGFISNEKDRRALRSEEGREKIAGSIVEAICRYKEKFDGAAKEVTPSRQETETNPAERSVAEPAPTAAQASPAVTSKVIYGTQIMALGRKVSPGDKMFKGHRPVVVRSGKYYKYIAGADKNRKKAEENFKKIKKTFRESFMVKVEGNSVKKL